MKKTNLLKGALSVLAVSVLLASCTQVDSKIDTVDTLETPSVKAVAYPGVNYISWNAVKGAANYKVTRTVDEGVEETLVSSTQNLYITDSLSVNDVDVEYKVYALSNTNPSRAVYVYDSNAGSASVTNIFPPVGTKAIDLPKYEKDSGWNFDKGADNSNWKDDFIPTAENIKVQLVDGAIHVTAPTKAYLSTRVVGYTGNKEEIFYYDYPTRTETEFNKYQNKTLSKKSVITSAGEYKFKATVNALGEWYRNAYYGETIFALNTTITIPEVKTSKATNIISVKYIDDAQTIARVQFEPAVSVDGKVFEVADYKVYRALSGTSNLEEVKDLKKDSITIGEKTTVVYVVDDTVPANNVAYDYYVVLSKDEKFENTNPVAYLGKASIDTTDGGSVWGLDFVEFDDDNNRNDVVVKVTPNSGNKIVSVAYAYSTSDDSSKVLDSEYKEENYFTVAPTIADQQQAFLIKDVPENKYVFVKAEFAEIKSTGKVNSVTVNRSEKYTVGKADAVHIEISAPTQKKGATDLLLNDWIGNQINVNGGELVSVKYATNKDPELAKVAAVTTGKEIKFAVNDYDAVNGWWWDYAFDIENAGEVGQYLAIAAEVKAKEGNAENYIKVQASTSPVSVSGDLPINIWWNVDEDKDSTGTKFTRSLKVNLSKDIYEATNTIDNYDTVEISYIATDSSYRIDEKAEWKKLDPIKVKDFESDSKTDSDYYHRSVNITNTKKTYDSTEVNTYLEDHYVIKVVTKYNVSGAKEEPVYLNATLPYMVKK